MNYIAYTDGAYSSKRDQGGIGVVILRDGERILEYSKALPNSTNNKAEITAIIVALKCIKKPIDSFTIYTDSMYCVGCGTLNWKRKKNVVLWKLFDIEYERAKSLCKELKIEHVKGHADDYWNNYVDKLAVRATHEKI